MLLLGILNHIEEVASEEKTINFNHHNYVIKHIQHAITGRC